MLSLRQEITMSFDIARRAPAPRQITPVDSRLAPVFCFALLTTSCALASFAFACATPFAAYAVVASAMLPLPSALLVVTATWIVNQAIGFGALGYPHNANTVFWGLVIGFTALVATASANAVLRALSRTNTAIALAAAMLAAYASYEVALLAFTPVLGGAGAFTATIIARLALLNLLWLIGLVAVCVLLRRAAILWRHEPAH
jgi:hypothetical protein